MSIQLAQPLPIIAFSANPIICALISNDYMASTGVVAVNALLINGVIADGDNITFKWNGVVLIMTAAADLDGSGVQFPSGDGSAAYIASLLPFFASNYLFNKDFTVDIGGNQLLFTARSSDTLANFEALVSGNLEIRNNVPGSVKAIKPWFAHHLEVWVKAHSESAYKQAYSYNVELDFPLTGQSQTDIGPEILHNFLQADKPLLNSAAVTECLSSIADYYITYAQYYGDAPSVKRIYNSPTVKLTLGGLSAYAATQRDVMSELCPNLYDETQNRFMRQGSTTKLVTADQPEWLYFIHFKEVQRLITVEIEVTDQDEETITFDLPAVAAAPYTKYQFNAGYDQLGIAGRLASGKIPVQYTIRLKTDTGYISAPYTFVVDYNWQPYARYFVYLNAYGAFQTIATTGKGKVVGKREKEDARLSISAQNAVIDGEFEEYNISLKKTATVNMGYDRSDERATDLLQDLFTSTDKYIYENGRLIPIGISSTDFKPAPDGDGLYATSFDYYILYNEERFTEDPNLSDDEIEELHYMAGSPLPPAVPGEDEGFEDFDELVDDPELDEDEFIDEV